MRLRISTLELWLAASITSWAFPAAAQSPGPSAPVVTTAAQKYTLRAALLLPGSVETVSRSRVAAPVAGLIQKLTVRDGDLIEADQVLAELDIEALQVHRRTLQAQMLETAARKRAAESKQSRAQELFDANLLPAEQLDDARFEVEAIAARYTALGAEIEETDVSIRQAVIRAPFAGAVTQRLMEVGMWVKVGDPVYEIVATDSLEVRVDVPEIHFSKVRPGQAAEVSFDALPSMKLTGKIRSLGAEAEPSARTFPVKIEITTNGQRVRPGMLASVSFAPPAPRTIVMVPKDALVERDDGWVVFTMHLENAVRAVSVRTGESVGHWTEVRGEIQAGDQVVIVGNERLRDGQPVLAQSREVAQP